MGSWGPTIETVKSTIETVKSAIEIVKPVVAPIGESLSCHINLGKNMKILESKVEGLNTREDDINTELNQAEVQVGKKRKREVEVWLEKTRRVTSEVDGMKKEYSERGYFPSLTLGMRVVKKIKEVTEHHEKGEFNGLLVDTLLDCGVVLPTTELVGESAKETLEKIWEDLKKDEINTIGVYGMGGVGKTTIMTHISKKQKETNHFGTLIWVTVSKAVNVGRLQNDIAKAVNLDLSNFKDPIKRAATLQDTLNRRKSFVLILDDLREAFSLEEVGIPIPSNECKLVLTTQSLEVCREMKCQRNFEVKLLSQDEAWNLFMDKVGRDIVLAPEVKAIARLVAEECACLPLTIVTVGRAMSGVDDIREWRNALNELEGSTRGVRNLEHKVVKSLKFSYHRLRGEKLRNCLLHCASYPEGDKILMEELIKLWIDQGLIDARSNRQAMFDEGHVILNILINNGMLERASNYEMSTCVKMHDSVRRMALDIRRVSPRFMVNAGDRSEEPPNEEVQREDL